MKVLITRLEVDGKPTASRLVEAGFEPILLPLTELRTPICLLPQSRPDFAIFTSAHGIELLPSGQEDMLLDLPVYAVGRHTADGLKIKAYTDIRVGPGTAAGLAELIRHEQEGRAAHGHYYCGRERAFDFVAALDDSDIRLDLIEVYFMLDRDPGPDVLNAVLEKIHGGAALAYSANGSKRLVDLITNHGSRDFQAHLTVIAISEQAALAFRQLPVGRLVIADEPTERGMIAALRHCLR